MNPPVILTCVAIAGCAGQPVLEEHHLTLTERYLARAPSGVIGDLQHLHGDVWCSDDDAYALPVVPFPHGPTEIEDRYEGWGNATRLSMFDANGSIVQVIRERVALDRSADDVMLPIEHDVIVVAEGEPELSTRRVIQGGKRQLEQTNCASGYAGKQDQAMLSFGQEIDVGDYDTCRVDRHFVGHGYYFHVIAVVLGADSAESACSLSGELASWTVENMQVGQGCGPRKSLADRGRERTP